MRTWGGNHGFAPVQANHGDSAMEECKVGLADQDPVPGKFLPATA
jgi:hypothetical protein